MRPKKLIILAHEDPDARGILKFTLETHGYRVTACGSAADALAAMPADLLLAALPDPDGNELARLVRDRCPDTKTVLLTHADYRRGMAADALLSRKYSTMGDILERVRILVQRKRGPKPVRVGERLAA